MLQHFDCPITKQSNRHNYNGKLPVGKRIWHCPKKHPIMRISLSDKILLKLLSSGGYNLAYLQRTKTSPLELARQRFPRPTLPELADSLANSISFLIVREPFERLLSAYRNKIEGFRNKYYKILAEQIVKKYRKIPKTKVIFGIKFYLFLNSISIARVLLNFFFKLHPQKIYHPPIRIVGNNFIIFSVPQI